MLESKFASLIFWHLPHRKGQKICIPRGVVEVIPVISKWNNMKIKTTVVWQLEEGFKAI